jgi:Asp-tRNA(Asn)/Glu-tRNA(Gln) amidotransferase A subunit family amidase
MQVTESLAGMRAALQEGAVSSSELVRQALETADATDHVLGVFVSRFDEQALEAAAGADVARASGSTAPLLGIPIGVKDILSTREGETTAQSLVLDRAWGRGDAECVARLRAAGAIVMGKTTTMEFAFGTPDATKPFPIPRNPWSPSRWTGGSSSGSAAGVAAGIFPAALGTDTGASVRMPAALCGVTGLKPTFGLVPKSGCVPLAYSLDHVGPLARSAEDCALLLAAMAGHDPEDPASADRPVAMLPEQPDGDLRGLRIGVDGLSRFSGPEEDPELEGLFGAFASALGAAGAELITVELPFYAELSAACALTIISEALAYHTPDARRRWHDYSASTRLGLGLGAFVGASDYVQAQRVRRTVMADVSRLFERVDLVATPTVSRPAPLLADAPAYVASFFGATELAFHTGYWNATGNPAISVPIGFTAAGLPLAGQLVGRPFQDGTVLRAAAAFQRVTDWHDQACPYPPAPQPPPPLPPATGVDDPVVSDLTRELMRMYGLRPDDPDELAILEFGRPIVRGHVERLHSFEAARYGEPALTFAPDAGGELA